MTSQMLLAFQWLLAVLPVLPSVVGFITGPYFAVKGQAVIETKNLRTERHKIKMRLRSHDADTF